MFCADIKKLYKYSVVFFYIKTSLNTNNLTNKIKDIANTNNYKILNKLKFCIEIFKKLNNAKQKI